MWAKKVSSYHWQYVIANIYVNTFIISLLFLNPVLKIIIIIIIQIVVMPGNHKALCPEVFVISEHFNLQLYLCRIQCAHTGDSFQKGYIYILLQKISPHHITVTHIFNQFFVVCAITSPCEWVATMETINLTARTFIKCFWICTK